MIEVMRCLAQDIKSMSEKLSKLDSMENEIKQIKSVVCDKSTTLQGEVNTASVDKIMTDDLLNAVVQSTEPPLSDDISSDVESDESDRDNTEPPSDGTDDQPSVGNRDETVNTDDQTDVTPQDSDGFQVVDRQQRRKKEQYSKVIARGSSVFTNSNFNKATSSRHPSNTNSEQRTRRPRDKPCCL